MKCPQRKYLLDKLDVFVSSSIHSFIYKGHYSYQNVPGYVQYSYFFAYSKSQLASHQM